MRAMCLIAVAAVTVGLTGCGGGNDAALKEMIAAINETADGAKAGDAAKAKSGAAKMKATAEKLKKIPDAEGEKLMAKHKTEFDAAMKNLQESMSNSKLAAADMMEVAAAMVSMGK